MMCLDGVSVTYPGGVTALHPTTIKQRGDEFAVLLVASGAGKSTLRPCINHLQPPSTGGVAVAGIGSLGRSAPPRAQRRQTGIIFQQRQRIGRLTALPNVLFGRRGYHSLAQSVATTATQSTKRGQRG